MARTCTICTSPRRNAVDAQLAGGDSLAAIARRFKLSSDALRRHKMAHLSPALAMVAVERYGVESARDAFDSIIPQLESLIARLEALMGVAEDRKSLIGASNLAREIRQSLELIGRLRGELQERPAVAINVLTSPEIVAYTAAIARVIELHPEIRADVVREFTKVPDLPALTVGTQS